MTRGCGPESPAFRRASRSTESGSSSSPRGPAALRPSLKFGLGLSRRRGEQLGLVKDPLAALAGDQALELGDLEDEPRREVDLARAAVAGDDRNDGVGLAAAADVVVDLELGGRHGGGDGVAAGLLD